MAHRELHDWERCERSPLTGAHGWSLIIERKAGANVASGVSCSFCTSHPPKDEELRLFEWMFAQEKERRAAQFTPFRAAFPIAAA